MIIETTNHSTLEVSNRDLAILRKRYHLIDDICQEFGCDQTIPIPITADQWTGIQQFADSLETPTSDKEWIDLLMAADYLNPTKHYNRIIREEGEEYIIKIKKISLHVKNISFFYLASKINNPDFLTPAEKEKLEQCEWIYTRGHNADRQCQEKKEVGSRYCKFCVRKRSTALPNIVRGVVTNIN